MNTSSWQQALQKNIKEPETLFRLLELDANLLPEALEACRLFPLDVTESYMRRMKKGDLNDPLLKQILPLGAECHTAPGYEADPLQEQAANPVPGLLHKYEDRVLLTIVGRCAINCRFCFRRQFSYTDNNPGRQGWGKALEYIAARPEISEVILSGGDPLVCDEKNLQFFSEALNPIAHIKRLRIHTRLPIVLPERITADFLQWLDTVKQQVIMIVHCNHPQELSDEVLQTFSALKQRGVMLLNQSVLLKNINDHTDVLAELNEKLFAAGVLPYYLHMPDKVQGTQHFDVKLEDALRIHAELNAKLSGYLVPHLVYESPGAESKIRLA